MKYICILSLVFAVALAGPTVPEPVYPNPKKYFSEIAQCINAPLDKCTTKNGCYIHTNRKQNLGLCYFVDTHYVLVAFTGEEECDYDPKKGQ